MFGIYIEYLGPGKTGGRIVTCWLGRLHFQTLQTEGRSRTCHTEGGTVPSVADGGQLALGAVCVCDASEAGELVNALGLGVHIYLRRNCSPAGAYLKDYSPEERNTLISIDLWFMSPRTPVP